MCGSRTWILKGKCNGRNQNEQNAPPTTAQKRKTRPLRVNNGPFFLFHSTVRFLSVFCTQPLPSLCRYLSNLLLCRDAPRLTARHKDGALQTENRCRLSPTPILVAIDQLSKGMQAVSHRVILLEAEVRTFQEANEALSKRRRAKRTRL